MSAVSWCMSDRKSLSDMHLSVILHVLWINDDFCCPNRSLEAETPDITLENADVLVQCCICVFIHSHLQREEMNPDFLY